MAVTSIIGVKMILRYESGSFTFPYLKAGAGGEAVYELGGAINSLQADPAKSIGEIVTSRVTVE